MKYKVNLDLMMKAIVLMFFLSMPTLQSWVFAQSIPVQSDEKRGPNIILILADDLGYGDLGVTGQTKIETPNLDKLAREGMLFTNHYSGATVCAPSRATLMTGLHTGHTPIRGNKEIQPEGQHPMPDSVLTLPKMMQRAGYATGAFGKWGLGFVGTSGDPINQGFDQFFGYNCQRYSYGLNNGFDIGFFIFSVFPYQSEYPVDYFGSDCI